MNLFQRMLVSGLEALEADYAKQIDRVQLAVSLCNQYNTGNWGGNRFLANDIRQSLIAVDVHGGRLDMSLEQFDKSHRAELKHNSEFALDTTTLASRQVSLIALTNELNQLRKIWPI